MTHTHTQTDRQTDRQTHTHTHTLNCLHIGTLCLMNVCVFVCIKCQFDTKMVSFSYHTFCFQEIRCSAIMVVDSQPKIWTMIGGQATVQCSFMERGGMTAAMPQIWMGNTSMDLILLMLMVLIGIIGKDINTPWKLLCWKYKENKNRHKPTYLSLKLQLWLQQTTDFATLFLNFERKFVWYIMGNRGQ